VLTNFFRAMPRELEEAAYVDGATSWQTCYRVLLLFSVPGLVTTGLLAFIAAWNDFLFALSFTQTPARRTVTVPLRAFQPQITGGFEIPWDQIMAATVIVTVPLILLALVSQRRILAGLIARPVRDRCASASSRS
jgi:trehalose/maltose transport system permease protein